MQCHFIVDHFAKTYPSSLINIEKILNRPVKDRVGSASQVDSVQLGNPVLAPDFKVDPSWLHFYHVSQVDSREHNLCPITKQQLILKTLDMIKFTLLRKLLF